VADEDARRGHGGAEPVGGDNQVITVHAERSAGRHFTAASNVQAEHGHA